ncbi:uncharacterized protein LOC134831730 [Culicoides brevitarsis]|uniref:uncharacterized protein LOC134831730 n=1 Tax=Culicoides brevitarsis TaxID=469753 RepID=UPI00307C26A3
MSSNFLDIPGRKPPLPDTTSSFEDDDHSFIILGSSESHSFTSIDREIELLQDPLRSSSPIMEGLTDEQDLETLINSELDQSDYCSIPEICESLIATIKPGMVIATDDSRTMLKESLEEIITRSEQWKEHLVFTRKLLTTHHRLRTELLEMAKEVVKMKEIVDRLQEEKQEMSETLERETRKKSQLLKKFKNIRETESQKTEGVLMNSSDKSKSIWIRVLVVLLSLFVLVVSLCGLFMKIKGV